MAHPKSQQVGGRKEAPLEIVGSELVQEQPQEQIFTPDDPEYYSYSELLKGYLEKLTRLDEVLKTKGHYVPGSEEWFPWSWLRVKSSENVFVIDPDMSHAKDYPPDTVLVAGSDYLSEFGNTLFYWMRPGQAGEEFFVDPEGKQLDEVNYLVWKEEFITGLTIRVDETNPSPENISKYAGSASVEYRLNRQSQTLSIAPQRAQHKLITPEYATHLFNTIDRLIPVTPTTTQQPERRASAEIQPPKALPPAR